MPAAPIGSIQSQCFFQVPSGQLGAVFSDQVSAGEIKGREIGRLDRRKELDRLVDPPLAPVDQSEVVSLCPLPGISLHHPGQDRNRLFPEGENQAGRGVASAIDEEPAACAIVLVNEGEPVTGHGVGSGELEQIHGLLRRAEPEVEEGRLDEVFVGQLAPEHGAKFLEAFRSVQEVALETGGVIERVDLEKRVDRLPGLCPVPILPQGDRPDQGCVEIVPVGIERPAGVLDGKVVSLLRKMNFGQPAIGGGAVSHRPGRPTQSRLGVGRLSQALADDAVYVVGFRVVHRYLESLTCGFMSQCVFASPKAEFGDPAAGAQVVRIPLDAFGVPFQRLPVVPGFFALRRGEEESFRRGFVGIVKRERTVEIVCRGVARVADLGAQFHRAETLFGWERHVTFQDLHRAQPDPFRRVLSLVHVDRHLLVDLPDGAESDPQHVGLSFHIHHSHGGGVGQRADLLVREPGLPPPVGRVRREEGVVALVQEAAGLRLGVLAICVGQEVFPDGALRRQAPDPDLPAGHVVVKGIMTETESRVLPVAAEEMFVFTDGEVTLVGAEIVVPVERKIPAFPIHGPGPQGNGIVVADAEAPRHRVLEIVGRADSAVHPGIVGLMERRWVVPLGARLETGPIGGKKNLHAPPGARREIEGAHETARAPVPIAANHVIHGSGSRRCVPDDTEVELYAAGDPGASESDLPELQNVIRVDELPACRLFHSAPDLPAHLGQQGKSDMGIFHAHNGPLLLRGALAQLVEKTVWIEPCSIAPLVGAGQDRHGVRIGEGVGLDPFRAHGDDGFGIGRILDDRATGQRHSDGHDRIRCRKIASHGTRLHLPIRAREEICKFLDQATRHGGSRRSRNSPRGVKT